MNCSSDPQRGESQCRQTFSQCSDQITEQDQWKGLPSVPGLDLQALSQSESGERVGTSNLTKVTYFNSAGFISCILVLYNCSASQRECKADFSRCAAAAPLRERNVETSGGNSLETSLTNNQGRDDGLELSVGSPSKVTSSGDVYTPRLADGSGKIPESKLAQLDRLYVHDCRGLSEL